MVLLSSFTRVFLFVGIILIASLLHAEDSFIPPKLELEAAIRLAIDRNPSLAAAKNEIQAAEGDKIAAGKRLNPAFSLQFEDFPINAHPGPFFDAQGITSRVDYEIERGGRRRLRTESANKALEARKLMFQDQTRLMRLEVERAFYRTILAKSNLEAAKSILDQAERTISLNRVRFQQGDISALNHRHVLTLGFGGCI
jgi:outer membrane protein, heavy metal efflux system